MVTACDFKMSEVSGSESNSYLSGCKSMSVPPLLMLPKNSLKYGFNNNIFKFYNNEFKEI